MRSARTRSAEAPLAVTNASRSDRALAFVRRVFSGGRQRAEIKPRRTGDEIIATRFRASSTNHTEASAFIDELEPNAVIMRRIPGTRDGERRARVDKLQRLRHGVCGSDARVGTKVVEDGPAA